MGEPVVTDADGVRWITLNRPEVGNALTLEDLGVVESAARELPADVRALVVTGSGDRAFSAGMHLSTFLDAAPTDGRRIITAVRDCNAAVRQAPVPTVAMLNGHCVGAAFELALACDLRVAHPQVRVGLPEVRLGIPSVVDAALLQHHVGLSLARELILTGDLYGIDQLGSGSFVNRLAPPERLRETVLELLGHMTTHTREVLAAQKRLFAAWLEPGLQHAIDTSVDAFAAVFALPATAEAIRRYADARSRQRGGNG